MKPSFGKRLTASYLFVVAVTLLFTGFYLTRRLKADFLSGLQQSLASQARLMSSLLVPAVSDPKQASRIQELASSLGERMNCRVTAIRNDGRVLGDSERSTQQLAQMENHRTRPEVLDALATGSGQSMRFSHTLQKTMLYVAVPIPWPASSEKRPLSPWGVVRVSLPLTDVDKRITVFQGDLVKAGMAALVVALGVALISVRKISRPLRTLAGEAAAIAEGRFPISSPSGTSDEFGQLARAFSDMSTRIEGKVTELNRERTQLAAILAALVEGIVAVDHQGRVLSLNPAAERFFEVPADQARGRPVLEVLRHSALHEVVEQALRERKSLSQEIAIHGPQERTLSVHAVPVSYGEGQTGVLAALHDITELRKLERVRQEFVANVSHELKTPLTAIKGYVETLLEGALEDKAHNREFLKIINDHANHLMQLIDDVLDLSAIEAKRVKFHFEPVSLAEATGRILKGLAPMAKAKGVVIVNRLSDALPKVSADRDKLSQILINLLDNAIKFNKAGGSVEITGRSANGKVIVAIRDTGLGIQPGDLPRIFERFYRADKARSHNITGTGLGLAIVKHLVEAHHGAVTAQSQPGQGSTFTFTLQKI